jgi:DNA-binding transcriptional regulator of glucitol operon
MALADGQHNDLGRVAAGRFAGRFDPGTNVLKISF